MKTCAVSAAVLTLVASVGVVATRSDAAESGPVAVTAPGGNSTAGYPAARQSKGLTCVFMGHSFFYRVANDLDKVAIGSGFTEHRQVVRVAHGIQGTPGWLWDNVGPTEAARRMLTEEKVDVLAISYHGRSADKCRLEDYSRWIDLARQKNPDIMFAIGHSWSGLRGADLTPEQYAAVYAEVGRPIHAMIDRLREKYPDNAIFVIPHGRGVVEMYKLFKEGKLPEIKSMLPEEGDPRSAFFMDTTYHAGPMALAETRLIFMSTIYQTDPRTSTWNSGFEADTILKQIAYDAVREDLYARPVKGTQTATTLDSQPAAATKE